MSAHSYRALLHWDGSTADGIRTYSREHTALAPPAGQELRLSADPAFRGSPELLNPEQLVVMAASSCQLLSFLAVAARAGVDVLGYDDEATSRLDLTADPARLTAIRLNVTVRTAAGTDTARIQALAAQAHRECYIANSLSVPVEVTTTHESAPG
ncbi:OsmC family peroxiredoxin [Streptomyces triticagri]|uniref:OsmC family peroxiredoxin n=1 Tax=Streptomyces triticagri TaxID=2293568 RepID=A0A372MC23_9ACTN|nr:OsmC family protein [Streptomyces triticagri]RFU87837.1 OsmC family peroxiredoxin [Streptomyces triticagri]